MSEDSNEINLGTLLGVDDMSEEQANAFMERVGAILIEASVGKLLVVLGEEKSAELQSHMQNMSPADDIFSYLLRTYPDFQSIVEGELKALHEQASELFGE